MRKVREDNKAVFDAAEKAKGDLKQAQDLLANSLRATLQDKR
jgi:hypothetical protein